MAAPPSTAAGTEDDTTAPPPAISPNSAKGQGEALLVTKGNSAKVTKGPSQGSAQWLARRGTMITASDFAAVLGHNPYKSRIQVFREKCHIGSPREPYALFVEHGKTNEPVALRRYVAKTGYSVQANYSCEPHPDFPSLGGSPDAIATLPDGTRRLVEIKCPFVREIVSGEVPSYYFDQIQGLMSIFDLPATDFVQFRPSGAAADEDFPDAVAGETLDITLVPRDPAWEDRWVGKLLTFWDDVKTFRARKEAIFADESHSVEERHKAFDDFERPFRPRERKRKADACGGCDIDGST